MPGTALSSYKYKLYFAAFWITWSAVHAGVLQNWEYTAETAWLDSIVSNVLLAGICLLTVMSLRYYLPRKEQLTYLLLMCVGFAGIWLAAVKMILSYTDDETSIIAFNQSIPIRLAIAILIVGCVILLNVLWYTMEDQKEQVKRKNDADAIARDAELYKLRQQLQPHFLFNSLNSISALVIVQPDDARKMIQQLSDYLRSTLKKEEHKWITLAEELEYLQLYLDIEKVRFGHRLTTEINSDENTLSMKLPAMLLQPIVENAIKFGLYDTIGDITIRIRTTAAAQMLLVSVENPFDSGITQPTKGTGFGLSSVQRRLSLLFSRTDLLSTAAKDNIFFTEVKIPQQ